MLVKHAMTHPAICIDENTTIDETINIMREKNVGFLPITKNDYLIGVITDRDILLRGQSLKRTTKISQVMTNDIICTIDEHSSLEEAGKLMSKYLVRRLVVTHDDLIKGVITSKDLLNDISLIPYIYDTYNNIRY